MLLHLDVLELTVQIVELEHEKVWLMVLHIIFRSQVYRHVDLVLDLNYKAQVGHSLSLALRKFEEIYRIRSDVLIFYVEVKYVEHRYASGECIVEVPHPLTLSLGYLLVGVEKLNYGCDPCQNFWSEHVHVVHSKHLKDLLDHQPDALCLDTIEYLVSSQNIS